MSSAFGPESVSLRTTTLQWLRSRWPIAALAFAGLVILSWSRCSGGASGESVEAAVEAALESRGLTIRPGGVLVLDDGSPRGLGQAALLRACRPGELSDLYFARVRSNGGSVYDLLGLTNISDTPSAEEAQPYAIDGVVAHLSHARGRYDAIVLTDVGGEPESATEGWGIIKRAQNAITNLQETGQTEGLDIRRYAFKAAAEEASLTVAEGRFVVEADGKRIVIDPLTRAVMEGVEAVRVREPEAKAKPGAITWVVDTIRNLSFVGPEPIAWLEHRVFGLKDLGERMFYGVVTEDTEAAVAEEMGTSAPVDERRLAELSVPVPELGWPPEPATPIWTRPLEGEGQWRAVVDDPFVRSYPNAPPAFYTTFLRPDPRRNFARAYIVLWDARQVQLHVVSGTREPRGATGEQGTGQAPRDPRTMGRVVAGFNGGFQALHGEFGVMADGVVYLPPKPWAATVGVFEDGRVVMGSWLAPPEGQDEYQESWALTQIPEGMRAYRQNLTSVIEDGTFNPWGRWWWGAAPVNAAEQTYIDRTGLCLTKEGHMAYFWGKSLGADALGAAMDAVRCVRGMHLDMNSRHTGFEFYNVQPEDQPFPELERGEDEEPRDSEFQGPVPDGPGYHVRARKFIRSMKPLRFPRYIGRDRRDFFYLTLRPVLPGPNVDEAEFDTEQLPHAGWPYAFARADLGGARVIRIDPNRIIPGPLAEGQGGDALAYLSNGGSLVRPDAALALSRSRDHLGVRYQVGPPSDRDRLVITGAAHASQGAAIGVDADGFLVYAEGEAGAVARALEAAGVPRRIGLPEGVRLVLTAGGESVGLDGYAVTLNRRRSLALLAEIRPRTEVLFPDVEPQSYRTWARQQDTRVRYFRDASRPARFIAPPTE